MLLCNIHVILTVFLAAVDAVGVVRSPEGIYNVYSNRTSNAGTLQPEKQISDAKAASPFLGENADARRPEQIDRTLADIRRDEEEHDKLQSIHMNDPEEKDYSVEESNEELDDEDSAISEERNPEDFVGRDLKQVIPGQRASPPEAVSVIDRAFNNKKSFSCPRIKQDFVTGLSIGDLTPEDFGIIAAMGDSLATGAELWPGTKIEFRGAAFPIGGDATIDGLVTIPNILREFNDQEVVGVSHGMGTRDQLPIHQLNVAEEGATSTSMPQQAKELVRRMKLLKEVDVWNTWTMVIITIGTEEICGHCNAPDYESLVEALDILNRGIHKAFVVLLGPIHVSSAYRLKANLLKNRCACSKEQSNEFMEKISDAWKSTFEDVQAHVNSVKRKTFGMLAIPMLTVTSRYPYSLFISNRPLLNRRGHSYAAKWLWNRLVAGEKYNLSAAILSEDAYYCPGMGCPYFRTQENLHYCKILRHVDVEDLEELEENENGKNTKRTKKHLYTTACVIFFVAFCTVSTLGTIFYQKSKKGSKGRFDQPPEAIANNEPTHNLAQTLEEELLIPPPKLEHQNSISAKAAAAVSD